MLYRRETSYFQHYYNEFSTSQNVPWVQYVTEICLYMLLPGLLMFAAAVFAYRKWYPLRAGKKFVVEDMQGKLQPAPIEEKLEMAPSEQGATLGTEPDASAPVPASTFGLEVQEQALATWFSAGAYLIVTLIITFTDIHLDQKVFRELSTTSFYKHFLVSGRFFTYLMTWASVLLFQNRRIFT